RIGLHNGGAPTTVFSIPEDRGLHRGINSKTFLRLVGEASRGKKTSRVVQVAKQAIACGSVTGAGFRVHRAGPGGGDARTSAEAPTAIAAHFESSLPAPRVVLA